MDTCWRGVTDYRMPDSILLRNVVLAALYWVTGHFAMMLAPEPSYALSIWPPAGIAFVAVLCLGYRMLPGVFIGAMPLTLEALGRGFEVASPATALMLAALEAAAITLQATLAAWLVRRFVGHPIRLDRGRTILAFLILPGPVACLLSATVSTLILYQGGSVSGLEPWVVHWMTWWVGDTLGLWLFGVVGLCLIARPLSIWRPRRRLVAVPLLAACVPIVVAQVAAAHSLAQKHDAMFVQAAERAAYRIEMRLNHQLASLIAVSSAYLGSRYLNGAEFKRVAAAFEGRETGLMQLTWSKSHPGDISLLQSPLGPVRLDDLHRHELEQSLNRAAPKLTLTPTESGVALLFALPVAHMHRRAGEVMPQHADLILAVADVRDIEAVVMQADMPPGLDIRLHNSGGPARNTLLVNGWEAPQSDSPYRWRDNITVGDEPWSVEVHGAPEGYREDWLGHITISAGAGVLYSGLLMVFLLLQSGRSLRVQRLVWRVLR